MTALLLLSLLQPETVEGTAAFSNHISDVAEYRGIDLHGWGSAVLDCDRIGSTAWVQVGGAWYETTVVDCTAAQHRELWGEWGRVVDLPWALWELADLPLMPVPAVVRWTEPGNCPGMVKADGLCERMEGER